MGKKPGKQQPANSREAIRSNTISKYREKEREGGCLPFSSTSVSLLRESREGNSDEFS